MNKIKNNIRQMVQLNVYKTKHFRNRSFFRGESDKNGYL